MMSTRSIIDSVDRATARAQRNDTKPLLITEESLAEAIADDEAGRRIRLRFPYIGDYVPKGYTPVDEPLFVDSSGFGGPGELALTLSAFLRNLIPGRAYAVTEAGEFQVYVQAFIPPKRKSAKEEELT